jgi:RNA polymerase sigma-70 factor (ECF subfamily)
MKKPPAPRRERGDAVTADQTEGSDAEVIERSLLEPEIFGTIFERHFSRICRYLRRRLGGALADELASETFAVAFDVRGGYDPSHPDAGPWLFGIATNLFRRHLRTERRQLNAFARYGIDPDSSGQVDLTVVENRIDASGEGRRLAGALAKLSDGDREVVLLRAWGELTYQQIAEALAIPVGTVRSRLAHARRRLRELLDTSGKETGEGATAPKPRSGS